MSKVHIDRDERILCGACWADCSDVFEEGLDDGISQVVLAYQVGGDPASGEVPTIWRTAYAGPPKDALSRSSTLSDGT